MGDGRTAAATCGWGSRCRSRALHQAVFAALAAAASLLAASRVQGRRNSVGAITFFGTLPLLVVHVVLVVSDPDESMFFPWSTARVPAVAGALLLYAVARGKVGCPAHARAGSGRTTRGDRPVWEPAKAAGMEARIIMTKADPSLLEAGAEYTRTVLVPAAREHGGYRGDVAV